MSGRMDLAIVLAFITARSALSAGVGQCVKQGQSSDIHPKGGRSCEPEELSTMQFLPMPWPRPCPYDFQPPSCNIANAQAPRDLTTGAPGNLTPKSALLTFEQASMLLFVNVHFHLGAEHKSDEYQDGKDSAAYDALVSVDDPRSSRHAADVRPGFMCDTAQITERQMAPYTFEYCKSGVEVGKSYEVHYVYSSAGYSAGYSGRELNGADAASVSDGLGGAVNGRGILNPQIVVQAVVFQIVSGAGRQANLPHNLINGADAVCRQSSVMYQGSSTGVDYNNTVCSPYVITWHVDRKCHRVSPESFDNMCKEMHERYGLEEDLNAKGARKLVLPDFVVKPEFVKPLLS